MTAERGAAAYGQSTNAPFHDPHLQGDRGSRHDDSREWSTSTEPLRIQTVDPDTNPRFYLLCSRRSRRAPASRSCSTPSFQHQGRADRVHRPRTRFRTFWSTGSDALAIGSFLLVKPSKTTPGGPADTAGGIMEQQKSVELPKSLRVAAHAGSADPVVQRRVARWRGRRGAGRARADRPRHPVQLRRNRQGVARRYTTARTSRPRSALGDRLAHVHRAPDVCRCLNGVGITNAHIRFLRPRGFRSWTDRPRDCGTTARGRRCRSVETGDRAAHPQADRVARRARRPRDHRAAVAGFPPSSARSISRPRSATEALTVELDDKTLPERNREPRTFPCADSVDSGAARRRSRQPPPQASAGPRSRTATRASTTTRSSSPGCGSEDEPVRHKMLDFIGDIYTCGYPVRGQFTIVRPRPPVLSQICAAAAARAGCPLIACVVAWRPSSAR